jgi:hypothetical protein
MKVHLLYALLLLVVIFAVATSATSARFGEDPASDGESFEAIEAT